MNIRKVVAIGMAESLDVAVGALFALGLIYAIVRELPPWYALLLGSVLTTLPDISVLVYMVLKKKGDHRELPLLHRPLFMIPLCSCVAGITGGWPGAVLAAICLTWHFVHDSRRFGSIGDINWLWPFRRRELPYMETGEWLERYWFKGTTVSVLEVNVAVAIVFVLLAIYGYGLTAILFLFATQACAVYFWYFYKPAVATP